MNSIFYNDLYPLYKRVKSPSLDLELPTWSANNAPAILAEWQAAGAGGTGSGAPTGLLCANMDSSSWRQMDISLFLCSRLAAHFFSKARARAWDLCAIANCFLLLECPSKACLPPAPFLGAGRLVLDGSRGTGFADNFCQRGGGWSGHWGYLNSHQNFWLLTLPLPCPELT